jgi:hypothetical protein
LHIESKCAPLYFEQEKIDIESKRITLVAEAFKKRQELLDLGISKEEVDAHIPLPNSYLSMDMTHDTDFNNVLELD